MHRKTTSQSKTAATCVRISKKQYGSDHPDVAMGLVNLGNIYASRGKFNKNLRLVKRAIAIKEKYYGPYHIEVAITLDSLGNAYAHLGWFELK